MNVFLIEYANNEGGWVNEDHPERHGE
jgi:hypothetical protein